MYDYEQNSNITKGYGFLQIQPQHNELLIDNH